MLEKALYGSKGYYVWILLLLGIIGLGSIAYYTQLTQGLKITGMSRDVSWGFYIAQFTYLVGVAASAVMLVLPYYFHHYKAFSKMIILGEFMAIAAVSMCMLFIVVDLGQPQRLLNVILHPTPNSILFWDMVVLNGYLFLNIVIGWTTLQAERKGVTPASWVKPLVYLSVIWAFSIHTVTAFLYAGIPGRHYWLTAILAARFLASAFCSGPAILLLLALLLRRLTKYDPGKEAIQSLAKIITYAMCVNVFFFGLELFTAFYSNIPGHMHPFIYLFYGMEGHGALVPFMWAAAVMAIGCLVLLIPSAWRDNENIMIVALLMLVGATWIDKGLALLVAGFIPNMFDKVTEYAPTIPELAIAMMVYAIGALILTVLWKVAVSVKKEIA
ncbi:MAG: menaquinol oxidoreductase [Deltaproteobacteria bacterium]|jgi:molybdopterin-containing oxidoreductase family membrane subunit|nr:NrfD/PsrC family molybdoenzyme membrane anchor subunit [Deltaproteobacteria bacterium]TSA12727.1 MAG: menaquinol oxidoreductase [Deltaproteobacteria bacterium]